MKSIAASVFVLLISNCQHPHSTGSAGSDGSDPVTTAQSVDGTTIRKSVGGAEQIQDCPVEDRIYDTRPDQATAEVGVQKKLGSGENLQVFTKYRCRSR